MIKELLSKLCLVSAIAISTSLPAAGHMPNPRPPQPEQVFTNAHRTSNQPNRVLRNIGIFGAVVGAGFILDHTAPVWFPHFEILTAASIEGDLVKKEETLVIEVRGFKKDTGEVYTDLVEVTDPALLFIYKTLGLQGVASEIIEALGDQGIELETYDVDETFEYELTIIEQSSESQKIYDVSEEVYDQTNRGRSYRFKVSRFAAAKIVDLVRIP